MRVFGNRMGGFTTIWSRIGSQVNAGLAIFEVPRLELLSEALTSAQKLTKRWKNH